MRGGGSGGGVMDPKKFLKGGPFAIYSFYEVHYISWKKIRKIK
jgi:hypothetical protein